MKRKKVGTKTKVGADRICTVCARRFKAEQVVLSRYPGEPIRLHKLYEHVRKQTGGPRPPEVECHAVWIPSGHVGVGHWMDQQGHCGPLREVNAQDDFLEQVGVKV